MSELGIILARAEACKHAFQPIVSTISLRTHGVEALGRFPGADNAHEVTALLDAAAQAGLVLAVERLLMRNAVSRFSADLAPMGARLFYNVDNRVFGVESPDFQSMSETIAQCGVRLDQVCWEISEASQITVEPRVAAFLDHVARSDMRIALDDFGTGASNFERLLAIEPDYVKIDRSFIDGMAGNARKQAIVAKLCGLAHALGYSTIAEGIETEKDFRAAREAGCDYAQGFVIARPTCDTASILESYDRVVQHQGWRQSVDERVADLSEMVQPVHIDGLLGDAAERFRSDETLALVPVVDHLGKFKGALFERDIRQLLLSDFGRDLMLNRGVAPRVESHARRCPVADIHAPVDAIVNSYVVAASASGLVLLDGDVYAGYLSNTAILRLAAERDISRARDQNPLTRLPGNRAVEDYLEAALSHEEPLAIAVIDFDNFKAFNDRYGFAAGDRALRMFGDAMREYQRENADSVFVGHIGGDDFLIAQTGDAAQARYGIVELCARFADDVASLYSHEDRAAEGISGHDRFGTARFYPLLRASAGLLLLPADRDEVERGVVERRLTALKARAKSSPGDVIVGTLDDENEIARAVRVLGVRLVG